MAAYITMQVYRFKAAQQAMSSCLSTELSTAANQRVRGREREREREQGERQRERETGGLVRYRTRERERVEIDDEELLECIQSSVKRTEQERNGGRESEEDGE